MYDASKGHWYQPTIVSSTAVRHQEIKIPKMSNSSYRSEPPMVNYKYIYNIFYNILHLLVPYHLVLDNEVCFNYRRNYCNYQCVLCTIPSRIHRDGNPVMYCFSGCQRAVINQLLLVAKQVLRNSTGSLAQSCCAIVSDKF